MKKNAKKMTLSRETLRLLDTQKDMKAVVGGMPITVHGDSCDECDDE